MIETKDILYLPVLPVLNNWGERVCRNAANGMACALIVFTPVPDENGMHYACIVAGKQDWLDEDCCDTGDLPVLPTCPLVQK